MLPENYQKHLVTQLNKMQSLMVSILVQLLQSYRWVRLEELSNKFPSPILLGSRRRKLQYIDGYIIPMAGGTTNHNQIALNISTELNFPSKD